MGIPGFQKWFLATFPEAATPVERTVSSDVFDHIAFDINQILHTSIRRAKNFDHLVRILFREIDTTLRICRPRRSVYFAFDGPGPLAKLLTQRKRRMRRSSLSREEKRKSKGCAFDTVELTPGTSLVYKLKDAIEYYCWTRLQSNRRFRYVEMRISGPGVPGEGELKIIDWLNTFIARRRNRFSPNASGDHKRQDRLSGESVMVVGSDADICLQGLATSVIQSFFVYVPNSAPKRPRKKKRSDTCISMWSLIRTLEQLFPGESNGCRLDFLLICMLNGNDYLPKLRGVGFDALWRRYLFLKGSSKSKRKDGNGRFRGQFLLDPESRSFNWAFLSSLLRKVGHAITPTNWLHRNDSRTNFKAADDQAEQSVTRTSNQNASAENDGELSDADQSAPEETIVYKGENQPTGTTLDEDIEVLFKTDDEDDDDDDNDKNDDENELADSSWDIASCKKLFDIPTWLQGVLWCIQMYVDGFTPDYGYSYDFPYAPAACEITQWIEVHDGDPFPISSPVRSVRPLQPVKAAMAMLPRKYANLLPVPLQPFFRNRALYSSFCRDGINIDLNSMMQLADSVPLSTYSPEEQRRLQFEKVALIRHPKGPKYVATRKVCLPSAPSEEFASVKQDPLLVRHLVPSTQSPPCLRWPTGTISSLLERSYKRPFRPLRDQSQRSTQCREAMAKPFSRR